MLILFIFLFSALAAVAVAMFLECADYAPDENENESPDSPDGL